LKITRIECARLEGERPRKAGSNARLGEHGIAVRPQIARITLEDGSSGFGACHAGHDALRRFLGRSVDEMFDEAAGVTDAGRPLEFPLWDLFGQRSGLPAYALAARINLREAPEPFSAPCYDTSLYFDDLHLPDDAEAADLMAREAGEGYARGHRAFKIKTGRGARHMPLEEGTRRDVAVVKAVRDAVGPDCRLMLDANNGYNLNLAKRVLDETAECGVFWLEEPFHEDPVLFRDLKEWMAGRSIETLLADGEGDASPRLLDWAREGLVDVVQYDIFGHGFTAWLKTGRRLDAWDARSAPHHYGGHYGNYAACHLAGAIAGFAYAEWDEAAAPGLDASGYAIREGRVHPPASPGFGLSLDETEFQRAVQANGGDWTLS
jgi:L-alanine-DL-glutamate epimerase-like enolase superfamily enzyme